MADYSSSKQVFANQMQTIASSLLKLAEQMDDLNASYSVHSFASGGVNQFIDGDFAVLNTHLTAQIISDVMFAIGTVVGDISSGIRNSLRECLNGGLP